MSKTKLRTNPSYVITAEQWVMSLSMDLETYFTSSTEQLEYAFEHSFTGGVEVDMTQSNFDLGLLVSDDSLMFVQYSVCAGWQVV